jgi:hypothetical protein
MAPAMRPSRGQPMMPTNSCFRCDLTHRFWHQNRLSFLDYIPTNEHPYSHLMFSLRCIAYSVFMKIVAHLNNRWLPPQHKAHQQVRPHHQTAPSGLTFGCRAH